MIICKKSKILQDFHDEDIDSLELTEKCVDDAEKEKDAIATASASEEGEIKKF